MLIIFFAIVVATSIWVYMDAIKNKIGKIPNCKSIFNISAGDWAICSLLLWVIVFPAYIINRNSLITIAKEHPIEATKREVTIAIFAIFAIIVLFLVL